MCRTPSAIKAADINSHVTPDERDALAQAAAIARDDVVIEHFGPFAPLVFAHRPEIAHWLHEARCCSAECSPPPRPPP